MALRRELVEGVRYLAATRLLLILLSFLVVLNLCLGADKLIVFFARDTLHLPSSQVGLVITAGGAGGVLGAVGTSPLCRWLGPLRVVPLCAAASGIALISISAAASLPLFLAGNLLYTWAIVAASVTLGALRQVLVPRALLGRVTAAWRLAGQAVAIAGAVLAGTATGLLGGNPQPMFAAAGSLTLLSVVVAWAAGLRTQDAAGNAASVLGR